MEDLLRQIQEKEEVLWLLYLDLQRLKIEDSKLFRGQKFSRVREACEQILRLISE